MKKSQIPLLVLLGPTAVGKTELAIKLAKELNTEIISADSRQVYKYMDIGTAKPSKKEQEDIRHHLIDIVLPSDKFSVADYKRAAEKVILDLHNRGKIPFLVGGSGLYIRSVIDGLFQSPKPDYDLREKLKEEARINGNLFLYEKLKLVDKEIADRLHPNDIFRIVRALEVFEKTGQPISRLQKERTQKPNYNVLMIGLTRERNELYSLIEKRVNKMIEAGLVKEVKNLSTSHGLGYAQILGFLKNEYSLEHAIYLLKRDTRRFAKRQMTWFRKDKRIIWFNLPDENIMEKIIKLTKNTFICMAFLFTLCLNLNAKEKEELPLSEEITRAELAAVLATKLDISSVQQKSHIIVDIGNHWAKNFIKEIVNKGIMETYSNHNFMPEQKVTRAEFAYYIQEIIVRLKKDTAVRNRFRNTSSPFVDVSREHIYYNPIILAVTTGILHGTSTDEFSPQNTVNEKLTVCAVQKLKEYLGINH